MKTLTVIHHIWIVKILLGFILVFTIRCDNSVHEDPIWFDAFLNKGTVQLNDILNKIDLESDIVRVQKGSSIQDAVNLKHATTRKENLLRKMTSNDLPGGISHYEFKIPLRDGQYILSVSTELCAKIAPTKLCHAKVTILWSWNQHNISMTYTLPLGPKTLMLKYPHPYTLPLEISKYGVMTWYRLLFPQKPQISPQEELKI